MFSDLKTSSIIFVLETVEFANHWNLLVLVSFPELNIFHTFRNTYFKIHYITCSYLEHTYIWLLIKKCYQILKFR